MTSRKQRIAAIVLGLALASFGAMAQAQDDDAPKHHRHSKKCLDYEPKVLTLEGTLSKHMDYGAPGFGEDPKHDAKEDYWRIDLDKAVCVNASSEPDSFDEYEKDIENMELVFGVKMPYPKGGAKAWIGKRVRVTGALFHAENGHHHTTVLITVEGIEKVDAAN